VTTFARAVLSVAVPLVLSIAAADMAQAAPWSKPKADSETATIKKEKMADSVVLIETSKGPVKIQLFNGDAPVTTENFLDLVKRGFYDGLSFHRYEPGFVIQGGDPKGNGTGGFIDPATNQERRIKLEVAPHLKHDAAGMVAMARSNNPDSASCQFYITLAPASFLDQKYAVFGKVIDGLPNVQQLRAGDKILKATAQ
jgi:peptidyl-prolyl cis-trans isomerase B (cyclophilin B)